MTDRPRDERGRFIRKDDDWCDDCQAILDAELEVALAISHLVAVAGPLHAETVARRMWDTARRELGD